MYLHMPASSPNLGEQQIHPLAIQGADEESATVEPQSRVSDRSRSAQRTQTMTMKWYTTNLELLQTLSLQYQYCLSSQDQHPVHTVHRPVPPRPVHKEHRPVPALRMNPPTTETSAKKENLAQQYRVHDERTVFYPDLYVLTNDEHLTMRSEAHKYAAAAGSFCFVTTENGEKQNVYNLTTILGVQRSLCLEEVTDDSSSTQVDFPEAVDSQTRDILDRCMATCGEATRSKSQEEIPCTKRSISPGSTRTLQAVC